MPLLMHDATKNGVGSDDLIGKTYVIALFNTLCAWCKLLCISCLELHCILTCEIGMLMTCAFTVYSNNLLVRAFLAT